MSLAANWTYHNSLRLISNDEQLSKSFHKLLRDSFDCRSIMQFDQEAIELCSTDEEREAIASELAGHIWEATVSALRMYKVTGQLRKCMPTSTLRCLTLSLSLQLDFSASTESLNSQVLCSSQRDFEL